MRCVYSLLLIAFLTQPLVAKEDNYWSWGWGIYGAGTSLDVARYEWSLINFGNAPADQRTVERCNEILRFNPAHRFVIRVWPIMGIGHKENRHQATFLDYWYKEGVRETVLERTRGQIRLIVDGLTHPESVVGITFLEELPGHFSASPFGRWRAGDPLPWDMKRHEERITAELGRVPDFGDPEVRLWWGKRYCEALDEIHRAMKGTIPGIKVIYWQATSWYTLDHLDEGEPVTKPWVVPIRYADVVKPGVCDGIFGYPNNERVWERKTRQIVKQHDCLFFSQTSSPAGMRLSTFADSAQLARWEHPNNLGTFFFLSAGRGKKAWNDLPYLDGRQFWSLSDLARRIAWDYRIGLDVVARNLSPQVTIDYNAEGQKTGGFVHVYGQVFNPRDASWYGTEPDRAVLRNTTVTLSVPAGFVVPVERSAPLTIPLGDIPPRQCKAGDWWVRVDGDGSIPRGQAFRVVAVAEGAQTSEAVSSAPAARAAFLEKHDIRRAGDCWIEPAYQLPSFRPAVRLDPLATIVFPQLVCDGKSVLYRGELEADTELVIGPGYRATLYGKPLMPEPAQTFATYRRDGADIAVLDTGYMPGVSPRMRVRPNASYRFTLSGNTADKCISHAIVFFSGKKAGEPVETSKSCFYNKLRPEPTTISQLVPSPDADPGTLTAIIRIYRHNKIGALHLSRMNFELADIPDEGLDVTERLEGALPGLARPFTNWQYQDLSDPDRYGRPKLVVQFFNPDDQVGPKERERMGGDDF